MSKEQKYQNLLREIESVLEGERDPVVWMSTLSCLLRQEMGFFWVGFYRFVGGELLIGPYQGTLGCLRISLDRGVCGAAASQRRTFLVPNVHQFPGHIACDSRSQSEIVIPVLDGKGELKAVLDVDSDRLSDFDSVDQHYLETIVAGMRGLEWNCPV